MGAFVFFDHLFYDVYVVKSVKNNTFIQISYGILFLGAGFIAGCYYRGYQPKQSTISTAIRANSNEYKFINPILLSGDQDESKELEPLAKQISTTISNLKQKAGSKLESVAVYFRDLNSGHWTGVSQDEQYAPSSMLKVVMMIGYLKDAETDPAVFNKTLTYESDTSGQHYPPTQTLSDGPHTVTELIRAMIVDSDNAALDALFSNNREAFINVFKSLRLPPPASLTTLDFMSPRKFSAVFRALYNGTYLSRPSSEAVLGLMTNTTFTKGLVAGVPSNTKVAHKFGEHTQNDVTGKLRFRELHDCGIVYYPTKPYFLCVMTRGQDFSEMESVIKAVSKTTYEYVGGN